MSDKYSILKFKWSRDSLERSQQNASDCHRLLRKFMVENSNDPLKSGDLRLILYYLELAQSEMRKNTDCVNNSINLLTEIEKRSTH